MPSRLPIVWEPARLIFCIGRRCFLWQRGAKDADLASMTMPRSVRSAEQRIRAISVLTAERQNLQPASGHVRAELKIQVIFVLTADQKDHNLKTVEKRISHNHKNGVIYAFNYFWKNRSYNMIKKIKRYPPGVLFYKYFE